MRKINKEEATRLYYEEGWSIKKLATHYHVTTGSVYGFLSRRNKPIKSKFTPIVQQYICEMYKSGESAYSLGRKLKCSHVTIQRIVRKNNIEVRTLKSCRMFPKGAIHFIKNYMYRHGKTANDVLTELAAILK